MTVKEDATNDCGALRNVEFRVNRVNRSPESITISSTSITENQVAATKVGDLTTLDADYQDKSTYVISGTDAASFKIGGTGNNELLTNAVFNFETKSSYNITITSTDAAGASVSNNFTINVTDGNEPPVFTSENSKSIPENTTAALTLSATDVDTNSTLTYSLAGGDDQALFSLSGTALSFSTAPNFENATDANTDNVYEVIVRASDGTNNTDQTVSITVTDTNESPTFSNNSSISLPENNTAVATLSASDADANSSVTYSLIGGTDQSAFSLSGSSLSFTAAPNFESPTDANTDNIYELIVRASDGTNNTDLSISVTITDTNETPAFAGTSGTITIAENTSVIDTLSATDPDTGTTLTYTISGGADQTAFSLNGPVLSFGTAPNFEGPTDANTDNVYEVTVRVSDGTNNTDLTLSVKVANANEAPLSITISNASIDENAPIGTVVGTLSSTDSDAAFTHAYSLSDTTLGFLISGKDLITSAVFDFEQQSSYQIPVIVTDEGALTFSQTLTIGINDLSEGKASSSITINPVEDVEIGSDPFELSAVVSPENATIVWAIIEGDATISGSTLTPGNTTGSVVVKASIGETNEYLGSEDTERFTILDPTLASPTLTLDLPIEASIKETIQVSFTLDAQGTAISESDVVLKVDSGPGTITGNQLTFTGSGKVAVSAFIPATAATNAASAEASIEVFAVYSLSGLALDAEGAGFTNGMAFIISATNFNLTESVTLAANGSFTFTDTREGQYYLGVGVNDSDQIYLTTYLGDKSPILEPNIKPEIATLTADISGLTINMQTRPASAVEFVNEAVGGKIEFQAQGVVNGQNRFVKGRVQMGDPIPNTLVILSTQADEYVADGLTDESGFITFDGLPTGDYKLAVEIPGVGRVETEVPVEEGEQADITGLISEDGTVSLEIEEALSTDLTSPTGIKIYPNPIKDKFTINMVNDYRGQVEIIMTSLTGKRIYSSVEYKNGPALTIDREINVRSGVFLLQMQYGDQLDSWRIVVAD